MLKSYGSGDGGDCVEKIEIVFLILVAVEEGCVVKEPILRGGNEADSVELSDF